MKRTFHRVVGMIIVAAMVVLAACSGGGAGTTPSGSGGGKPASSSSSGGEPKTEEPVTIKIMANFPTADITAADKAAFEKVEEALNVKLEWIVPPASGYQEQLQLSLVSGDYPDVVFFPSETHQGFLDAVNDGVLIPINEYLENMPNLKQWTYDVSWEALQPKRDGNIYGIPRTTIARHDGFLVRQDWLDAIGFKMPEDNEVTIEEFTDILRKFTFNDPDGNGLNDTYGLMHYLDGNKTLAPVLSAQFGNMGWQETNGGEYKYMHPQYDPNSTIFKDMLAYTQMLYKEGVVDPDAAVIDINAASDRLKRGVTGVRGEFAGWVPTTELEMKEINPNVELTYLFVKNQDGTLHGVAFGTGIWGLWGITNNAKNPEKAIQVFDWLLSDEGWQYVRFGVEGYDYKLEGDKKVYDPEVKAPWRGSVVRRAGDGDFFLTPSLPQEDIDMIKPWIDKAVANVSFSLDRGFTPEAARDPKFLDFKLTWGETITKIIVGDLPVDAFDQLLTDWYANGGKEYVEQMNEFIESTQQ